MNNTPLFPPGLEVPDGRHLPSRRAYMAAAFPFYRPYSDEMIAAAKAAVEPAICFALYGYKKSRVTHSYFEYLVDLTWDNWSTFHKLSGTRMPSCPWAETGPGPYNISEGDSTLYAQWLEGHSDDRQPFAAQQ